MNEKISVHNVIIEYNYTKLSEDKPVIVLLHGWGVSKEVWNQVYKEIIAHNFSCLSLDFPGFGGSSTPKIPWRVLDYANVLVDFLAKLNIQKVILVGHSFGGRVSLVVSAKNHVLVEKLVLVDSAGFRTNNLFKKILSVGAKFVKPLFRLRFIKPFRKTIYKSIGAEDYTNTPELKQTFINVIGEDLTKYLPHIVQPTKIIWGHDDLATPVFFGEQFNKNIKNSHLVVLKNAGHYSFIDKFDEFNKELLAFIA